jgi:hypothetical protein
VGIAVVGVQHAKEDSMEEERYDYKMMYQDNDRRQK